MTAQICNLAATRSQRSLATSLDRILPNAYGLGWIGADKGCDIFLGRVRKGTDTLPCSGHLSRLLALLEAAEDRGALVELVVR